MIDYGALRMLIATGKVPKKPDLERLDASTPKSRAIDHEIASTNSHLYRDARRNHAEAKAELVAFGVNGEVEFFRAALAAGLKVTRVQRDVRTATRERWGLQTANDNTKSAARAA